MKYLLPATRIVLYLYTGLLITMILSEFKWFGFTLYFIGMVNCLFLVKVSEL